MSYLTNNAAVIAVAAVASLMAWMFGGTCGNLLVPVVPWLFVLLLEILCCFPQRQPGETTYDARERVWREMKRDPVFLVSVLLMVLLLIPFVNTALCPVCDQVAIARGASARPPVPFLPYCVNRMDHLNVVLWFAVALPSLLAVRHCMNRAGKRLVLEMIVWNGAALAVLGFVQSAMGAPGPLWNAESGLNPIYRVQEFFSTFGYANMAGDYFTTLFGISVALWRDRYEVVREEVRAGMDGHAPQGKERTLFWSKNYFLIPATIFFFAALNTLSRAAIMLVTMTAVVYFLHTFVYFLARMHKARRVKAGVWSLLVLGLIAFCAVTFMPSDLQREVDTLDTRQVLNRVSGKQQCSVRVATAIWKDNLLFGCGGWGYTHFCMPKMTKDERKALDGPGSMNVHNDYLQFLAEHGTVGFAAMVAIALLLFWPVGEDWMKLIRQARFAKPRDAPPRPVQIFALPAPVFCILTTTVATIIHAFGDCPLRSPAVLSLFFISLAALPGFMPTLREN